MNEQAWLIGILAVIAVAVGVQTVALVAAARALRRLEARLDLAERELRDLRPRLERLGQLIDRVADWSDEAAARLPRVSAAIDSGIDARARPRAARRCPVPEAPGAARHRLGGVAGPEERRQCLPAAAPGALGGTAGEPAAGRVLRG